MKYFDKVKRIVHRCSEEIAATKEIASVLSFGEGMETFRAKIDMRIMNHNGGYENEIRKRHLLRKHEIMIKYYEKTFGDYFVLYDYNHANDVFEHSKYSDCIWVCWWQGLDQAPPIVKACIESIKKNSGKHQVIVLTDENYKKYVQLPEWVEKKRRNNHKNKLFRFTSIISFSKIWWNVARCNFFLYRFSFIRFIF
ncbi:Capsular polysaccharide synthesis protein [Butyrivibrio sp. YAB3001]|nr:Capsular polysaccharide synthesis protein [Butyrivibrio sp. YAB3001]